MTCSSRYTLHVSNTTVQPNYDKTLTKFTVDFLSNIVVKERRKRQALERRTKELERLSRQAVKHYDARFIELASEVCNCVGDRR